MTETVFKLNAVGSVALVTIDNGEDYRKPTTLGRSAFESAVAVLEELEQGDWTAAVFTGKPFVFCVGADIDEFTKTRSADDAREGIRAGHGLFGRIRALPFPTVAAINGAVLGGGLELALHCTARTLASNVRHIGFPEVALSIIPAWGGTQLLPQLIGPEAAAKVIVLNPLRQNKLLTAPEALELGIADRLLEPVEFLDESLAYVRELGDVDRPAPDWSDIETVLRKTRSRVDDAVHGATRAPYVALDLIAGAQEWSIDDGYAAEEAAMAELLVSPQAQASAYAFTVVERRSKRPPELPDAKPRRVQKVGIVGAGLMATQLATLFLRRLEVPVVLRDIEQSRVDEALATIREDVGAKKPFLATLVDGGTGWEQFEGCDLVLEAVFEELDVKQQVFAEVRRVAPGAILATNTSSLSVEAMGADVGLHFFNPVALMPLVEIVRTPQTSEEVLATAWDVVKKLKKRGVFVADAPGFVVNRVLTRVTRVLLDALENGNTVEETDEAMLSLGMPMAPSVVLQMVGPRVANHVLMTMHEAFPDRFSLSPVLARLAEGNDEPLDPGDGRKTVGEIREEVLEAAADEIHHLLDEGVVGAAADVDACLILGAGYPFFLGGITKHLDQFGISERVSGGALAGAGKIPAYVAKDDYRIRIEIEDEHAGGLLERLGLGLSGDAADLASDLEARRLVVSRDGDDLFVYAATPIEAENARSVIQAELRDNGSAAVTGPVEHWLDDEDRWSDEPPGETWEEEAIDRGYAPWEVRVGMASHGDARDLADRLEQEGFAVERRWRYLIVGTASKEEADALASRVHGEVEPGGELVYETVPGNPFAVFGGMGGSGAPIG